jgi:hypothetical protein
MCTKRWFKNRKGKDHMSELKVYGSVILTPILLQIAQLMTWQLYLNGQRRKTIQRK